MIHGANQNQRKFTNKYDSLSTEFTHGFQLKSNSTKFSIHHQLLLQSNMFTRLLHRNRLVPDIVTGKENSPLKLR
jgi:hypothetical protein